MRKFPSLRPRAYAEEMHKLIERAGQSGPPRYLHEEIAAISERSGVSIDSALMDLVKAGIVSSFNATKTSRGGFGL